MTDWGQKSSVGEPYSDAGFVVMDAWKDDVQASSNPRDDLKRKYEELQGKFYGLAKQIKMLEAIFTMMNMTVQKCKRKFLLYRLVRMNHLYPNYYQAFH